MSSVVYLVLMFASDNDDGAGHCGAPDLCYSTHTQPQFKKLLILHFPLQTKMFTKNTISPMTNWFWRQLASYNQMRNLRASAGSMWPWKMAGRHVAIRIVEPQTTDELGLTGALAMRRKQNRYSAGEKIDGKMRELLPGRREYWRDSPTPVR